MKQSEMWLETRCVSSLEKVFPDEELKAASLSRGSALRREIYSFQVAYRSDRLLKSVRVKAESSGLGDNVKVSKVGLVPSELPCYADHDRHVLRSAPGLYPDPLYPLGPDEALTIPPGQWRSLWIAVELDGDVPSGEHLIAVAFTSEDGLQVACAGFTLEVIPAELPEQELIHTEWFHTDCLATFYGVEVFGERHWQLIESYVETAVKHGMNMILTPLFTPPLDTAVGGERLTVQLVDVEKSGDTYRFRFDRLLKWIGLCDRKGIRYFEFSHLFTQWGARHAPKIVASTDGAETAIFGWQTDASGEEYGRFLDQFLPSLLEFLRDNRLEGRCYFHVSDEPGEEHMESYRKASEILRSHTAGYPVIDALSDYGFYEKGLVSHPIPSNDHIEPFLEAGVPDLWTYYCCNQYKDVSNRFMNMPSSRSRILGAQLYKYGIKGFLHWGYNFWYSQHSRKRINPYQVTDADLAFPSGDAFLVYPGERGPVESIRLKVLNEALQDLRALKLLESLIGRRRTELLLEEGAEEITFKSYPRHPEWLLEKRERINLAIREHA